MADTMTLEEAMNWLDYAHRKGEHSGGGVGGGLADAIDVVMTFVNEPQGVTVPLGALERDREVVMDLRKRLAELEAREAVGRVKLTDDIVRTALQDAWDDYCSDAQAFPDCFRIERGPKLYADFDRCPNFILSIRLTLEAGLLAAQPAPSPWRPIAETDKHGSPLLIGWLDSDGVWQVRRAWWDPEFTTGDEWDEHAGCYRYAGAWTDGAVADWACEARQSYDPTHVAALPAPPPVAENAGEGAEG